MDVEMELELEGSGGGLAIPWENPLINHVLCLYCILIFQCRALKQSPYLGENLVILSPLS